MSLDLSKLQCVKRGAGGQITARCPVCGQQGRDKSGNHLSILPTGQFNCIVGSAEDPLHNRAIRSILRGYLDFTEREEVVYIEPRLEVEQTYPESTLSKLLPQYDYWIGRGMKEEVLRKLENGVASSEERGKLSGRTIFPVRDLDNRIMGFSGRLLTDSSYAPRWKHCFKSSRAVYPWNVTGQAITEVRMVILVESVGDLLGCLSHDVNPILCIFGLNLNSLIISTLLAANVKRVIISLNRDDDPRKGQAAADKIANKLANFFTDVRIVLPPIGRKDWGECSEKGDDAAFGALREALV